MIDPYIHTPSLSLELHVIHMPGVVNAKNLSIEIDVPHEQCLLWNRGLPQAATHDNSGRTKKVGVSVVQTYEIKKMDTDYFIED